MLTDHLRSLEEIRHSLQEWDSENRRWRPRQLKKLLPGLDQDKQEAYVGFKWLYLQAWPGYFWTQIDFSRFESKTRRALKLAPNNDEVKKLRAEVVKLLHLPE